MVYVEFLDWKLRWLLAVVSLSGFLLLCRTEKITKKVLITADDEKLRDPEGYEAIAQLHHQMDDDQSGSIDRYESTDFLKEDMQLGGSDRAQRERKFHHNNDELITVDDLWEAWFASEERSWTTADLVNWLENTVRLPQYTSVFIGMEIDGRSLPRMAVANSTYLSSDLGIKNPVHKQKLRLKALDVVLFGFSGNNISRVKDVALSVLLIILVTVLFVLKRQRTRSRLQMEQLTTKLSQLKLMQSHFEDVQQKFENEQKRRQSTRDAPENEQVESLRSQLLEAERLLENSCSAPLALQPLLRRTCELEMSYIGQQRMECIAEMREAIEHIDKLRRKQLSIVSSIKLATGASSGTDHIDSRIFALKARMEKISLAMSECHQRWIEIESLCGFQLVISPVNTELMFPSPVTTTAAGGTLPRPASSCSFYRNSDVVGAAPTTISVASSSTSGNSPSATVGVSSAANNSRLSATTPGCLCVHESFESAAARQLQKHAYHDGLNVSLKSRRFANVNDIEVPLRSASSQSLSNLQHSWNVPGMEEFRTPSFNSSMASATDTDATSIASTVNSITTVSSPPAATATINRTSPLKQDLKLLKRNFSNALLRLSQPNSVRENGFTENKRQLSSNALVSGNSKKSKIPNLFRKIF